MLALPRRPAALGLLPLASSGGRIQGAADRFLGKSELS